MSSLDPVNTQKDEILALNSIFGKEFTLHRPENINEKYEPPHISVLINVDISSTDFVDLSLKIHFDCAMDYPLSCPTLSLSDVVNISNIICEELIAALTKKSIELKGMPMIYHLVVEAREILLSKLDKRKSGNTISVRNNDDIQKENKLKLKLLRQRRDLAKKESKKAKKTEKCFHTYQNLNNIIKFYHSTDKNVIELYKGICEGNHRLKTISSNLQLVFNTFEGFNLSKGTSVKIHQISLSSVTMEMFKYLKSDWLKKLEDDFTFLYDLHHNNLLPYIGFRSHIHGKQILKKKYFDVNIQYVTPNCGGVKLSKMCELDLLMEKNGDTMKSKMSIIKIKDYLKSVLKAVGYLHDKNITFIKINMDSIMIDKNLEVKLCHYYIWKRFQELREREKKKEISEASEMTSCLKKGSKKHDIIKVAKLAKKLFFFGVPEEEINEADMPLDLIDFISCAESNPDNLHVHPFLYPNNQTKYFNNDTSNLNQDLSPWKIFQQSSRIPQEFKLISKLGEGAFGDVVKVRNIYDNQFYAIKRVRLNCIPKKAARTMMEVQLLSSLNHENIVRYYASWSEEIVYNSLNKDSSKTNYINKISSSTRINVSNAISIQKPENVDSDLLEIQDMRNSIMFSGSVHYPSKMCNRHFDLESYSDSGTDSESEPSKGDHNYDFNPQSVKIVFQDSNSLFERDTFKSPTKNYFNEPRSATVAHKTYKTKIDKFLMIQMELCEGACNTLQKFIETQKLYLNKKLIWRFIREIVSGLEHIHSKNMIHRDLKPNNIFLDHQKRIKIGDLGLGMNFIQKSADPEINQNSGLEENQFLNDFEKGPVGTALYICPDMLTNNFYTNKVDMYSLGIIIFEMCYKPFQTNYERFTVLNKLRLPEIEYPNEKEFKINSEFKKVINCLLNHDHTKRPSASELLKSNFIPPPEGKEMEFRQFLIQLTKTSNSNLYKLMLKELFHQTSTEIHRYELPVLYQSPFKYYLSNTLSQATQILSGNHLDEGDYTYFILKRLICGHIESVFVSHCAIEFTAPLLSPNVSKPVTDKFTLLDSEGVVVSLPDNLRTNFADFLLNNNITSTKRFAIGPIYQRQEYRRDHPQELVEAAFDIVSDYYNSNKPAEVLFALHQIFNSLLHLEYVSLALEINHTDIFNGLMNYYKIPTEFHKRIHYPIQDQTISDIDYFDSDEFRESSNLSKTQFGNFKHIMKYNESLDGFERCLKQFLNRTVDVENFDLIMNGFNELRTIEKKVNDFSDNYCFAINIRPTLIPLDSIYKGFVFQLMFNVRDKFFDCVNYSNKKHAKLIMKYLKSSKKISYGGDYSSYLWTGQSPSVTENGDMKTCSVSAVGVSIDVSTMIQCLYSMKQLFPCNSDLEIRNDPLNGIVSAIVQYDDENDRNCRELMTYFWTAGINAELYDLDGNGEEYAFNQKINFFIKFLPKNDKKSSAANNRIFVTRGNYPGTGIELDDSAKVVEYISKELQKVKDYCLIRSERDNVNRFQRQASDVPSIEVPLEVDTKKSSASKTETITNRYIYKFINVKDCGKFNNSDLCLSYFVETNKHMQSLTQKNADLDGSQIQIIVKVNCHLLSTNKWFQGRFPNPLYCIIAELSYSKCHFVVEEASLKSLKDPNKLLKIFNKIESLKNYSDHGPGDKQWKDVISRIWEALQIAVKEKIFRISIYSQIDDRIAFLDIK